MIDIDHLFKRRTGEELVFLRRSHWITFLGDLIFLAVLTVLPIGVYVMINGVWPSLLIGTVSRPIFVLATSAFYLMLWLFFITKFIEYYLDVYIVTSERILDVSQMGLFDRTVSELDIARIQDVTSEVKGVLHSMINFGNVIVQTAAEQEHFVFEDVARPDEIRKRILDLVDDDRKRRGIVQGL